MSVESKNSQVRHRLDGDRSMPGPGLKSRVDAAPDELKRIQKVLSQRRIMRDTTNHPDVELSSTGRKGAVQRRLAKSKNERGTQANIADSGAPDSGDGGDGLSGGGDAAN